MANTTSPANLTQRPPTVIGGNTSAGGSGIGTGSTAPSPVRLDITKFQFRKLFTLEERIALDNAQYSSSIPPRVKATLFTLMKDLEVSNVIQLGTPEVTNGIKYLMSVGLLTKTRADRILANLPPL